MMTTLKNDEGYIISYIEWRQVGQSGFDKLYGEYIFVNDLWVHPEYRHHHMIEEMISRILMNAPEAQYCYFIRRKYNDRMSKLWKRASFENLVTLKGVR